MVTNRSTLRQGRSGSSRRSTRGGAVVIEFAIVLPIFITLVFGILEVGRMLMVQEILVNAAREGARTAVASLKTDAQVKQAVDDYLSAADFYLNRTVSTAVTSGYSRTISPSLTTNPASGTPITVTVTVSCSSVSWLTKLTYFGGRNLSHSVTMYKQ